MGYEVSGMKCVSCSEKSWQFDSLTFFEATSEVIVCFVSPSTSTIQDFTSQTRTLPETSYLRPHTSLLKIK